ncbi:MAG: hypothetical protein ACRDZ4_14545, partial [Egibacteraceae bacterium]
MQGSKEFEEKGKRPSEVAGVGTHEKGKVGKVDELGKVEEIDEGAEFSEGSEFRHAAAKAFVELRTRRIEGAIKPMMKTAHELLDLWQKAGLNNSTAEGLHMFVEDIDTSGRYVLVQVEMLVSQGQLENTATVGLTLESLNQQAEELEEEIEERLSTGILTDPAQQKAQQAGPPALRLIRRLLKHAKHELWVMVAHLATPTGWGVKGGLDVPFLMKAEVEIKWVRLWWSDGEVPVARGFDGEGPRERGSFSLRSWLSSQNVRGS